MIFNLFKKENDLCITQPPILCLKKLIRSRTILESRNDRSWGETLMSWRPEISDDPRIDITEESFWCTLYVYKTNVVNTIKESENVFAQKIKTALPFTPLKF